MKVVAFRPEHLARLKLQPAQAHFSAEVLKPGYTDMLSAGQAFTAMDGDRVLACAGLYEIWSGRALAWALIGAEAGRHMLGIHRAVAGFLLQAPYRRIEALVDDGFAEARRWIELLGFQCETPQAMAGFNPDGRAAFLYSRVK